MSFRRNSFLALFFLAPACSLYNSALLDEIEDDDGGDGDGDGDGDFLPFTGGSTSGGGSTGGGTSGGASTGSNSGDGGGPGPGGDTGSGGEQGSCDDEAPALPSKTTLDLIDDFNVNWPRLNSSVSTWDGSWTSNAQAGSVENSNYTPKTASPTAWEPGRGGYVSVSCDDSDLALHLKSTGSDDYGVGFDGRLMEDATDVDLSAYSGLIFFARTPNSTKLKVAFALGADPDVNVEEVSVPPIGTGWGQAIEIPIPSGVTDAALIKFVAQRVPGDGEDIDIWIDNVGLYTE